LSAIAADKLTIIKRKSRKYSFSAIISHITIASLIIGMVAIGYQAPVGNVAALSSAQSSQNAGTALDSPTVDQVASANMAAVAAQSADVIVATNVKNLAVSLNAKSATAQSNEAIVNKPQIFSQGSGRDIRQYTTKAGDNVQTVATAYGLSVETVRWANNLASDALSPGTTLKIPSVNGIIYTVKSGDTAATLASKYQSDSSRITTYNDAELTGLQPGQQIVIPSGVLPTNERPGYTAPSRTSGSGASTVTAKITVYGGNGYDYGYCTWYAFNRRAQLGRPIGSNWGNASTWSAYAASAGYGVNGQPEVGAVMQNGGGLGHVAVVERVDPDGSITVSEMNYNGWNVIDNRSISASQVADGVARGYYKFIH
jgi:surface antigen